MITEYEKKYGLGLATKHNCLDILRKLNEDEDRIYWDQPMLDDYDFAYLISLVEADIDND